MSKKILLLGVLDSILADVQQQVARPDFEFFRGTSVEDVRSTLARTTIDHVIMGGGIELETRLDPSAHDDVINGRPGQDRKSTRLNSSHT